MHGTATCGQLPGTSHRRTLASRATRCSGGPAIENGTAALDSSWRRGGGRRRRRTVDRARPRLRHDHATRRRHGGRWGDWSRRFRSGSSERWRFCFGRGRSRSGGLSGSSRRRHGHGLDRGNCRRHSHGTAIRGRRRTRRNRRRRSCGHRWPGHHRTRWRLSRNRRLRRSGGSHRSCRSLRGRRSHHNSGCLARLRNDAARRGCWRGCRRRYGRRRRWNYRLRSGWSNGNRRRRHRRWAAGGMHRRSRRHRPRRRGMQFLLAPLQDRLRDIPHMVNLGPVDLRLWFSLVTSGAAASPASLQNVCAHKLGFMLLNRAGVRLLFRHADFRQSIQNGFALDFQFPR